MTTKQTLHAGSESIGRKPKNLSPVLKVAAAVFAMLYIINGTGAAAGYAKALRTGQESSALIIAQTVWVGVTWPVVLHDMMIADPLQRLEPRPDLDA